METREARSSAIHVGLPFRSMWANWGGIYSSADRAQAAYLYRGVFDPEMWLPAPSEDEAWTERSRETETWSTAAQEADTWTERAVESESWSERGEQSESWTRKYPN